MPTPVPFLAILAFCLATLSFPSNAAPPRDASVTARLASCDSAIVRAAADEMLREPKTLQEPLMLFHAASGERVAGRKEEAAFLYLAARLRTSRQILFEKGDRPQLLAIMMMTVGPLIMPVLEADPELARRVVRRVIDWDRSTPDPFRDREAAKSGGIAEKLAEIDAGLARLPDQIRDDPDRVAKARDADEQAGRQIKSTHAERCGPGTLDPVDAEAATERIKTQAEGLARTHPFVLGKAGGAVKSVSVGAWKQGAARLPSRLTVSVTPATGKTFYAEVDAEVAITPERKLGSVKMSLACLTDLWIGQRDASWKDVCRDDPKAIKPPNTGAAELKQFDFAADAKSRESIVQKPTCGFPELKLPAEFSVFAAGAHSGRKISFQIDQSGHEGTRIVGARLKTGQLCAIRECCSSNTIILPTRSEHSNQQNRADSDANGGVRMIAHGIDGRPGHDHGWAWAVSHGPEWRTFEAVFKSVASNCFCGGIDGHFDDLSRNTPDRPKYFLAPCGENRAKRGFRGRLKTFIVRFSPLQVGQSVRQHT